VTRARLRVLISAYACEPDRGSEPGLGFGIARQMAELHDVWVLTRANNRGPIQTALKDKPISSLIPVYFDLPPALRFWKRGPRGVQLYYLLWQRASLAAARKLHMTVGFDLVHHVTFAKCWSPSGIAQLGPPFLWGPLGGGDSTPRAFLGEYSLRGRAKNQARECFRTLSTVVPALRATASRSTISLAATEDTAMFLSRIGARDIRRLSQAALDSEEIDKLASMKTERDGTIVRFACLGNLLCLKGFNLAVAAFARASLLESELWIIGDGPERRRLEQLAASLGVEPMVRFHGRLARDEALQRLSECDVLVHPALHDTSPWACVEAMALGLPVIALAHTGPQVMVPPSAGILVQCVDPRSTIESLALAMSQLANDPIERRRLGDGGRREVRERFSWTQRGSELDALYRELALGETLP